MSEATATNVSPKDKALTKAYGLATKELREAHRDEFNQLRVKHTKALGFEWTPAPTAKDKAKAELDKILAEFPDLISEDVKDTPEVVHEFNTEEPATG